MELEESKANTDTKQEVQQKIVDGVYMLYEVSVLRNKRRRSEIWHRFFQVYENTKPLPFVACKECLRVYPYKRVNGTAGILRHNCVRLTTRPKRQQQFSESNTKYENEELSVAVKAIESDSNTVEVCAFSNMEDYLSMPAFEEFTQMTVGDGFEHLGANVFVTSSSCSAGAETSESDEVVIGAGGDRERTPEAEIFVNPYDIFEVEDEEDDEEYEFGELPPSTSKRQQHQQRQQRQKQLATAKPVSETPGCPNKQTISTRCDECDVDFNNLPLAMMHRGFHGSASQFQCHQCSDAFVNVYQFWEHISNCLQALDKV